ncbi:hypothetical protein PsYK624_126930 [Phanerochaete sordida]|uniref:Terpenoid synthase n=1 Tax=Phanerochaete sordida TaxID=48140 RepID=A0A9P3GKM0_9APHY|nr:hypothetical protein PsYK624_126930 [Phanerochaete sordida]
MYCVSNINNAPALVKPSFKEPDVPPHIHVEAQRPCTEDELMQFTRTIVNDLLARTGIRVDAALPPQHAEVDARVRATVAGWDIGNVSRARLERYMVTGIMMSTMTFGHTALETQVMIALNTTCVTCIDDDELDVGALAEFAARLQAGQPQLHPLLDRYAELLRRMPECFCPYSATAILADSINFVNSTLFEGELESMRLRPAAGKYPTYKRARNGLGDVYAAFIWDKFSFPDVSTFIQAFPDTITVTFFINEVLSFYKEELSGDTKNFVHDCARIASRDTHSFVRELLDGIVAAVDAARGILDGEKEREAWERWLTGFVSWHILTPRYRIASLVENGAEGC